ncbi:ArnT family glycosyltransferase [Nocardia jiangxiensis]|uniref:ArnT family glycosyltransferase n=1 Tax=Nocardia jiangxiensis TaxID=282685 RepID=A0ABW6RXU3_9NOCA
MSAVLNIDVVQGDSASDRPRFAVAGFAAVVVLAAIALGLSIGRYGFFGDELYFISAGRRLAESYADQGPAVPAIARSMDLIAPGSLVAVRIPAVLVTLAAIVVTAQIAREFGGSRSAQVLAATAYAVSPFLLPQGGQLSTNVVDTALWVVICWLVVRWVRTRRDSLLLWAGLVTALDMQVKWLVPFLWLALVLGVLAFGPREMLRRPALWCGAAVVAVTMAPSLIWQARHGWPQLGMGAEVAAEQDSIGGRFTFVPLAVGSAGVLGVLLLICGLWALFRAEVLRPYRFLGVVPPVLIVAFVLTDGRPYYIVGCYAAVLAAGAVWWTQRSKSLLRNGIAVVLAAVSAVMVILVLPLQPERELPPAPADDGISSLLYAKFGWPELAAATAATYRSLPAGEREETVVITDSYWQASALDVYRHTYGLPAVYSPSRGFGYFGVPPDSARTVLWVGGDEADLRSRFGAVTAAGRAETRLGLPGVTRDVTIWRCADPREPWSRAWPGMLKL